MTGITYKEMVDEARKTGHGTERTMEQSVRHVSDMLERIKDSHNDLYWSFMREEHGIMYNNHYSETFARWDVSQMFHTEDGEEIRGEYFSMQQAAKIAKEHGIDNVADVYVAVNANYHDRVVLFSKWFTETDDIDARIVSDAVTFYFGDEDAADGKIWRYINGTK